MLKRIISNSKVLYCMEREEKKNNEEFYVSSDETNLSVIGSMIVSKCVLPSSFFS
jgi:hypothetical protein